ncbi:MAG TPA: ATP-binding cassette domain-containing protein [Burkholderiaceae bacterium]|nr:ATP-binding cassette domain-containing protein [Burkholderiaceae bacterium]
MLLEVNDLQKHFPVRGRGARGRSASVKAVDGVSFSVGPGETYALVGESGCGKTTIAKLLLLLERPTGGSIRFDGSDILQLDRKGVRDYRRHVQAVFQDPSSSLNPRLRVSTLLAEPILAHEGWRAARDRAALRRRLVEVLEIVGLPVGALDLYPHEFSGGQRQRIAVARALALRPRLIVLDEPTSALDVSIRAQIINLLSDIQREFGLSYVMIAHDLALVEHFSTTVGVMYLGKMVENGNSDRVFAAPAHPYTQALLGSAPRPDPDHQPLEGLITGEIGSALDPPSGCRFHPRCPHMFSRCAEEEPLAIRVAGGPADDTPHTASCHLLETTSETSRMQTA